MSIESEAPAPPRRSARPPLIPLEAFDPAPHIAEQILSNIASPDYTIALVAQRANTSIESLTLWLTRPDIAARLDAIESVYSRKARLDVATHTGAIIHACHMVIGFYTEAANHVHIHDHDHRGHEIATRKASNALLASRILIHLGKHHSPRSTPRPSAPNPSPNPDPDPNPNPNLPSSSSDNPTRFTILPALPDVALNNHDAHEANRTTPNNPARDNALGIHASTSPSRQRRPDPSDARQTSSSHLQPEGLTGNSRGLSESSSETPGPSPAHAPHPEGVQLSATRTATPCACHTKSPATPTPCRSCASAPTPAATLLTIAGTTARARDPTPSHR